MSETSATVTRIHNPETPIITPEREDAVTAELSYSVTFMFKHPAALRLIEMENDNDWRQRTIIQNTNWHLEKSCEYGGCWILFTCDEPFNVTELQETCERIQLLDDAFETMIKGTQAEKT